MQAIEIAHAPVAQLDRVTDYESVGQGFESLPAYQNEHLRVFVLFCFLPDCQKTRTRRERTPEGVRSSVSKNYGIATGLRPSQ